MNTTDLDPQETAEWQDAFATLVASHGAERARFILDTLATHARTQRIGWQPELVTPYVNTIAVDAQPAFPGDLAMEERLASLIRWNALAMVVRANQAYGELGGHIASYASAADLFETGYNHFFQARSEEPGQAHLGDLVFFQPHSAPGVYARAYLEGRLTADDLSYYRQVLTSPQAQASSSACSPRPTTTSMKPKPRQMPARWGKERRSPKFTPEAKIIVLLGPGVMELTSANKAAAMKRSWLI